MSDYFKLAADITMSLYPDYFNKYRDIDLDNPSTQYKDFLEALENVGEIDKEKFMSAYQKGDLLEMGRLVAAITEEWMSLGD